MITVTVVCFQTVAFVKIEQEAGITLVYCVPLDELPGDIAALVEGFKSGTKE